MAVFAGVAESVTFTVKLVLPETVGVPEIIPVDPARVSPAGRDPVEIDQLYGVVPPVAARVAEYATPTDPFGRVVVVIVTAVGVTEFDALEGGPVPAMLIAATVKVYAVAVVSPVMVVEVPVPLIDSPPHPEQVGLATTVYPVMGDPPVLAGAVQVKVTLGPFTEATGVPGAPGTVTANELVRKVPPSPETHVLDDTQLIWFVHGVEVPQVTWLLEVELRLAALEAIVVIDQAVPKLTVSIAKL